ncbi:hypothetical protein L210DRAFT_3587357 [Boletus edulis BED1]|uniref:Uncharacterized protein n=1 Tax=Boletus edulis BED1 TaxID=1328754 RepID=A0AAD4BAE4_BOLED|nr:hypothetical protein L210DRAFT_3587357 [Boletus edulis BED1]
MMLFVVSLYHRISKKSTVQCFSGIVSLLSARSQPMYHLRTRPISMSSVQHASCPLMVHELMIDGSESFIDHVHSKGKRDKRRPRSRFHKYWPRRAVGGTVQRLSINTYRVRR